MKKNPKTKVKAPTVSPYFLKLIFNGETFEKKTTDLKKTILDLKPVFLHTEMYMTLRRGENEMERRFNLKQGRNLFINQAFLEVFIATLLF